MKLDIGYPSLEEEQEILSRRKQRQQDEVELNLVTGREQILEMKRAVEDIYINPDIERYIVELVNETRHDSRVGVGSSPRGSLALLKLSLAQAAMDGRDYVLPDDVKAFTGPALVHRLILVPDLWMKGGAAGDVINSVLETVSVPVIDGV
jgi:MoxR-like ATPase